MNNEVEGFDMIDVVNLIERKKKMFLSILLTDLEEILNTGELTPEQKEFVKSRWEFIRKAVLDYFNDYTRSINRVLVGGDVETGYASNEPGT